MSDLNAGYQPSVRLGVVPVVGWAATYALAMCILRALVLLFFGPDGITAGDAVASLLRFPGHILFGVVLALLWLPSRTAIATMTRGMPVVLFVFLNLAAAHYEAGFGHLPSMRATLFLSQLEYAAPSIAAQAPLGALLVELMLTVAILALVRRRLRRCATSGGESRTKQVVAVGIVAASFGFTMLAQLGGNLLPPQYFWDTKNPLLWFFQGMVPVSPSPQLEADSFRRFQAWLGHRPPFGRAESRYPLCAMGPRGPQLPGNRRSVILVVLESVGRVEMRARYQGRAVMPALARIAEQNFEAQRLFAGGAFSGEALVALMTGIPPQTAGYFLYRQPLNTLDGLPRTLAERGYRTVFMHGSELAFEQQTPFLEMVGFEEIYDRESLGAARVPGMWGIPDGEMFTRLQQWIDDARRSDATVPYLAAFSTISSHHPYRLPDSWPRVFTGDSWRTSFYESLRYLDAKLADFYAWYLENEAPRGTILVLVGDHSPQLEAAEENRRRSGYRFDVACVICGLDPATRAQWAEFSERTASQFDLPATLRAQLDLEPGRCDQGLNILAPSEEWPEDRLVYAVGGDNLRIVHVWSNLCRAQLDRHGARFEIIEVGDVPAGQLKEHVQELQTFLGVTLEVNGRLFSDDAYAPPVDVAADRPPLPAVGRPIVVAHRGSSGGMLPPAEQNRMAAVRTAVAAGFTWVEVDTMVTADHVVVLNHDWELTDAEGQQHRIYDLTLAELRALPGLDHLPTLAELLSELGEQVGLVIEAKKQPYVDADVALVEGIRSLVSGRDPGSCIVDSMSPTLAGMLTTGCACPVGLDVPAQDPIGTEWVTAAKRGHFDWLFVHRLAASPDLIAAAHAAGIRVMIFPVGDPQQLQPFVSQWPDGIIADHIAVQQAVDRLLVEPGDEP